MWTGGGFLSVGVGGIGIVVPGLPTTVFFIIAAWCFSHSSPRFEHWVLDLPRIGPMVRDHRAGLGMPRRAKRMAIGMMWVAVAVSAVLVRERWWVSAGLVALAGVGTWYIARRVPTAEVERARRQGLEATAH